MAMISVIPVGTNIVKRTQGVEQTAHANLVSVPVMPINLIKSNALLQSTTYATASLMQMERTGDLKAAIETIRIIQTSKFIIKLRIVVWPSVLLMEAHTDHAIARCSTTFVKSLATSESTA